MYVKKSGAHACQVGAAPSPDRKKWSAEFKYKGARKAEI